MASFLHYYSKFQNHLTSLKIKKCSAKLLTFIFCCSLLISKINVNVFQMNIFELLFNIRPLDFISLICLNIMFRFFFLYLQLTLMFVQFIKVKFLFKSYFRKISAITKIVKNDPNYTIITWMLLRACTTIC